MLNNVHKNVLKEFISQEKNVSILIKFYSDYCFRRIETKKLTKHHKQQIYKILPVIIVNNKTFWSSLVGDVNIHWFPRQFKYLVTEYEIENDIAKHPHNKKRLLALINHIERVRLKELTKSVPNKAKFYLCHGQLQGLYWAQGETYYVDEDDLLMNNDVTPAELVEIWR